MKKNNARKKKTILHKGPLAHFMSQQHVVDLMKTREIKKKADEILKPIRKAERESKNRVLLRNSPKGSFRYWWARLNRSFRFNSSVIFNPDVMFVLHMIFRIFIIIVFNIIFWGLILMNFDVIFRLLFAEFY